MEVTQELIDGWRVIKVVGEIDSKTVTTLRTFLDEKLVDNKAVALDLSGVPFMSSAGLRTILILQRKTSEMKIDLALVGVSEEIQDTMKVTGFLRHLKLYEAIKSLP